MSSKQKEALLFKSKIENSMQLRSGKDKTWTPGPCFVLTHSDHTSQGGGVCALIIFIWPPIPQFSCMLRKQYNQMILQAHTSVVSCNFVAFRKP